MVIEVMIAEKPEDLDEAFRLRHQVFVDEGGYFPPTSDRRLFDRFDTFESSVTFVAYQDGQLACSMRLTIDHPTLGLPADGYYDFRPKITDPSAVIVASSHLCSTPGKRGGLMVLNCLWRVASLWCMDNGWTHMIAAFNPPVKRLVERAGWAALEQAPVRAAGAGPYILPMVLTPGTVADHIQSLCWSRRTNDEPEHYRRAFFRAGEAINLHRLEPTCQDLREHGRTEVSMLDNLGSVATTDLILTPIPEADISGAKSLQRVA